MDGVSKAIMLSAIFKNHPEGVVIAKSMGVKDHILMLMFGTSPSRFGTWAEVDALGYTFDQMTALGLKFEDIDK